MLPQKIAARLNKVLVAEHEHMIGQLAVRHGFITHAQLREALVDQASSDPPMPLGSILVARGWMNTSQLVSLVEEQRRLQFAKRLRLPLDKALRIMRQVALAVHHAHQHGVVHRDLKPGNIMLDEQDVVRVLDFGLAHLVEGSRTLTDTGTIVGTPAYMSPEQARGEGGAKDAPTDIYSMGATLYELVTGRPPFMAESVAGIIQQVCEVDPLPPRRRNERLPRDVETIVLKAMDKEPRRRYATAADLAEDLRRFQDNEPILAQPPSLLRITVKRLRRNPLAYAFGGAAVVAMIVASLVWTMEVDKAKRLRQEQDRLAAERGAALEMLRETARLSLRASLELRRAGANAGMRQFMPALEAAYERALERAPELAEVDYLMGRMYRALMMDDRALEFQERAIRKDPGYVPALYERVVLNARVYRSEYQKAFEAARVLDEAPDSPQDARGLRRRNRQEIEQQFPELAKLREQIEGDYQKLVRLSEANALAARGIWQYVLWKLDDAEAILTEAVKKDPGLEEAWQALAHSISIQAGSAKANLKELRWSEAEECYARALAHDRGYVPHLVGRAHVRFERANYRRQHGQDPALDDAAAIQANPLLEQRIGPRKEAAQKRVREIK